MQFRLFPKPSPERQLEKAIDDLNDAVYRKDHWGFSMIPSEKKAQNARIHNLIRRVESLGGNALKEIDHSYEYMVVDAMPEVFERISKYNPSRYETVRRSSDAV